MSKILGYKILRGYSTGDFTIANMNDELELLISNGWEPYGLPIVTHNVSSAGFVMVIQPMIHYGE